MQTPPTSQIAQLLQAIEENKKRQNYDDLMNGSLIPKMVMSNFPNVVKQGANSQFQKAQQSQLDSAGMKRPEDETMSIGRDGLPLGIAGLLSLALPKDGRSLALNDFMQGYMGTRQGKLNAKNKSKDQAFDAQKHEADTKAKLEREKSERADNFNMALLKESKDKKENAERFKMAAYSASDPTQVKALMNQARSYGAVISREEENEAMERAKEGVESTQLKALHKKYEKVPFSTTMAPNSWGKAIVQYNQELSAAGQAPYMNEAELAEAIRQRKERWYSEKVLPKIINVRDQVLQEINPFVKGLDARGNNTPEAIRAISDRMIASAKSLMPDLSETNKTMQDVLPMFLSVEGLSGKTLKQLSDEVRLGFARDQLKISRDREDRIAKEAAKSPGKNPYEKQKVAISADAKIWDAIANKSDTDLKKGLESTLNSPIFNDEIKAYFLVQQIQWTSEAQKLQAVREFAKQQRDNLLKYRAEYEELGALPEVGEPASGSTYKRDANGNIVESPKGRGGVPNTPTDRSMSRAQMLQGRGRVMVTDNSGAKGSISPEIAWLRDNSERLWGVKTSSTFRSPKHNDNVGGASKSMHLHGEAADLSTTNVAKGDAIVKWALENGASQGYRQIIWRDKSWKLINGKWVQRGKISGHYDHVHIGR